MYVLKRVPTGGGAPEARRKTGALNGKGDGPKTMPRPKKADTPAAQEQEKSAYVLKRCRPGPAATAADSKPTEPEKATARRSTKEPGAVCQFGRKRGS